MKLSGVPRTIHVHAHHAIVGRGGAARDILTAVRGQQRYEPREHALVSAEALRAGAGILPREARKMDRFSLLTLSVVRRIFETAQLDPAVVERCGMYVGNMLAGWTFTEPQIRALHTEGPTAVSPFLATAWFPAAAQGHTTIALGMRGIAKTITTDRCSGGQAIGMAFHKLRAGYRGPLLAGGVEAPVTPLVTAAFSSADGSEYPLAEGAGFLLLEAGDHEARDDRYTIGAHTSFRMRVSAVDERMTAFVRDIDLERPVRTVVCNVPPAGELERSTLALIRRLLGQEITVLHPCRTVGDTLGASAAVAAVLACESLSLLPRGSSVLVVSLGHQCADLLWLHS